MKEDDIKREIDRMITYRKPNYPHDDGALSRDQIRQIRERAQQQDEIELVDFIRLAVLEEREACAKIADTAEPYKSADLIRARGN